MKKFKIKLLSILILIVIMCFIVFSNIKNNIEDYSDVFNIEVGQVGNEEPVTRDIVAKMLALATNTKSEIVNQENYINFEDVKQDNWNYKYINQVYKDKIMSGVNENLFLPDGYLTLEQTQFLIDNYDKNNNTKIKLTSENKDKPITYALWCEIYKKIVPDVEEDEVIILLTNEQSKDLKNYYCITDKGLFSFEGLSYSKYLNKKIKILKKDTEVLAILEVLEEKPTLTNCYVQEINEDEIIVFIGGIKKVINLTNDLKSELNATTEPFLADITLDGDNAIEVEIYKEYIRGNINLILDNTIRVNNKNYIKDDNFKVYSNIDGDVKFKSIEDLIIGQDTAKYFIKQGENKIYGAIIDKENIIQKVRVIIKTDDYKNIFFDKIKFNSKSGMKVLVKGKEINYNGDYILNIEKGKDFSIGEKEILKIEPLNQDDSISILGLKRGYQNPEFKGTLEICKINNQYLIINELDIDEYIKSVMSSNTEITKEEEVIKTFAIILRNNTINKIYKNEFFEYGANFDDSLNFQLYNNLKTDSKISQFVDETKNVIIKVDNEIPSLNYFAYSSGTTSNSGEVWADKNTNEYPTNSLKHQISKYLFKNTVFENLEEEINANIFFKTKNIGYEEDDSPWFRWSSEISINEINQSLNQNLKKLYLNYPNFIKTLQSDGNYKSVDLPNITKLNDIKVNKRGQGGNIIELELFTNEAQILLTTDTVIKSFFQPSYIINNNGQRIENINLLPSSCFVFDKTYNEKGEIQKINIYGGGYGHGVGLSMYGAKKLAEKGLNYTQILNSFYSNIEISTLN